MKRLSALLIMFITVLILLFLSGCATTQYILTGQYTNANTEKVEQINISVSENEYNSIAIGDTYSLKIHTLILGITVPITKYSNTSGIGMADLLSVIVMVVPIIILVTNLFRQGKSKWEYIATSFAIVALSLLLTSTTAPDFNTVATIVDKTSGVFQ